MVWAPSSCPAAAILWFRDVPGPPSHLGPPTEGLQRPYGQYIGKHIWEVGWMSQDLCHTWDPSPTEGLQRPYGQYTVYTYGRWAGCRRISVMPGIPHPTPTQFGHSIWLMRKKKRQREGWTSHCSCPSTASCSNLFVLFTPVTEEKNWRISRFSNSDLILWFCGEKEITEEDNIQK